MTDFQPYIESGRVYLAEKAWSSHPADEHLSVVLCCLPGNTYTPFVTWIRNATMGQPGTVDGHYHETIEEAAEDFKQRGKP